MPTSPYQVGGTAGDHDDQGLYNDERSQVPLSRIDIDMFDVDALDEDQAAALLGRLDRRGSGPAMARADLRAGLPLIAATVTSIIAWFFPLTVLTVSDDVVLRFFIWTASSTESGLDPGWPNDWIHGVPFVLGAALALWGALVLVRARGRVQGWLHRQLLFTAGAGLLIGVCGLQTFSGLASMTASGPSDGVVSRPGAALFLIGLSTALAITALALNRLSARSR